MRLVKISVPPELGHKVIELAYSAGIDRVSAHEAVNHTKDGGPDNSLVLNVETSTPKARDLIRRLLSADFFDPEIVTFNVRQPRSIVSSSDTAELTLPLVEPPSDLFQELWQFSHVTYGLAGRLLVAGCLLAYGLINGNVLLIIAGLLFIPILPMIMAVSFGVAGSEWRLARQGVIAVAASTLILFIGGIFVALLSRPPIQQQTEESMVLGLLISLGVGIAAALAAIDDAGRRELIGLAAASQLAIIPVWVGITAIFGLPPDKGGHDVLMRLLSFVVNLAVLVAAILIVQYVSGAAEKIERR